MGNILPTGYQLRKVSNYFHPDQTRHSTRALLVKYMKLTYQELYPWQKNFNHLPETVNRYFSAHTPVWVVEKATNDLKSSVVGCLWIGTAIDQQTGARYAHIFLIFVLPEHRHRGIGKAMMQIAEDWAKARGDSQLGLQVFPSNKAALKLYQAQGFVTQFITMIKPLNGEQN